MNMGCGSSSALARADLVFLRSVSGDRSHVLPARSCWRLCGEVQWGGRAGWSRGVGWNPPPAEQVPPRSLSTGA